MSDSAEDVQRRLQGSVYVDDDGSADTGLREVVGRWAAGRASYPEVLAALVPARLLVPVVALLGEVEYDERGLARDKSSDMAAVLMTGADGRRALIAFTGTDTLASWNPDARPVPVSTALAAQTAVQEGAAALVVDIAGPATVVIEGEDLGRVAAGWRPVRLTDGAWGWLGAAADPVGEPDDSAPQEQTE